MVRFRPDRHPPDVDTDRDFSVHLESMTDRLAHAPLRPDRAAADGLEAIVYGAVAVTARAIALNGAELTFPQWRVLVIVGETTGGASVSQVAARLGSELSPTSRVVRRLAGRGLVLTTKSVADRRVTHIQLTAQGRELRDAVLRGRRALLEDVLAEVGDIVERDVAVLERIGQAFARYR
jgi:DNA-binding MarR family transcriptional regulator